MKTNPTNNQDNYLAILSAWSIFAASGILILDHQMCFLGLAILVMIVIFSVTCLFPYASYISMITGSAIYLAAYFSIFPFSWSEIIIPGCVVLIFFITAGLGTYVMNRLNKIYIRLQTDVQLLTGFIQYDSETGLLRWHYVRQRLDDELVRSRRFKKSFSLLMMEVVNYSHEFPEDEKYRKINQSISRLLSQTCRSNIDIPFGGDHFGVILPETDSDGSVGFAKRLLKDSARKELLDLRVGIVSFPDDAVTSETMIDACEVALKEAVTSEETIVRYDEIRKPNSTKESGKTMIRNDKRNVLKS